MSKWAIVGDAHWGVRGDSKNFHRIMVEFFKNLIVDLKNKNINKMILLGDVFERRKFINFETLFICKREVFDALKEANIEVYVIVGNHDVYFKNTNRINSLELLLPKSEYPNITTVVHDAEEILIDDEKVLFVPWVNKENYDTIRHKIDASDARIMVAHLDMAGFEMHKGAISDRGHFDADFLGKFDMVLTGHYHTKSSKGNIHYLGTPYPTSWNDYGEEKGYHILEDGKLTFIKNEKEVFYRFTYDDRNTEELKALVKRVIDLDLSDKYVKLYVKSKKNLKKFEMFVEGIENKLPADLNVIDETNFVTEGDGEIEELADTLTTIHSFIFNDLETSLDKERLYKNMAVLYQNALEITNDD